MPHATRIRLLHLALLLLLASGTSAPAAESVLDRARALYYAAEYDAALLLLNDVSPVNAQEKIAVERYRAAALLALGRSKEADAAFERLVTGSPHITAAQLDLPPWIAARFTAVRDRVIAEIEHLPFGDSQARASVNAPRVAAYDTPAPAYYTRADTAVRPPVAIHELVPRPPAIRRIDFSGTALLQVDVAVDGSVEHVTLEGPLHPIYAAMVRDSAAKWRYEPAQLDGRPVRFRKALTIEIR